MKRVLLAILILVSVWQLIQLPTVNATFFAFLTLGINPLTNHPFSTISLVSLLLASVLVSLLLFFSRAVSDFFGGFIDWLTQTDRPLHASTEPSAVTVEPATMSTLPAHTVMEGFAEPGPLFAGAVASIRSIPLPQVVMPTFRLPAQLTAGYRQLVAWLIAKLHTVGRVKQTPTADPARVVPQQAAPAYIAPELAEVVSIFEKLAHETAEPAEAVLADTASRPSASVWSILKSRWQRFSVLLGIRWQTVTRGTIEASAAAGKTAKTAEQQAGRSLTAAYRTVYRMILIGVLGILLAGGVVLHTMQSVVRSFGRAVAYAGRQSYRGLLAFAVTVTLVLFAIGRGITAAVQAVGRAIAAVCRTAVRLLANVVMLGFLIAGYALFVFSLLCFMVWEVIEPYVHKADRWLEKTVDGREGLAELTKVMHEMTRTFVQWYRVLRNIKHSIYH